MFISVIQGLTTDQKRDLGSRGITRQLVSDWRTGRRLPTEPQVVDLAEVAQVNRHTLQDEIALLRATPEQRPRLARAMEKLAHGVAASIALAVIAVAALVAPTTAKAHALDNVYYVN